MRHLKNTLSVIAATLLTALAVYGGVELVSTATGTSSDSTIAFNTATTQSTATQTCPATGCTASSCHAAHGSSH